MADGLRERKKQETRRRISDVATSLFAVRGFEAVTVDEIAAAADVSKMTVFNYFARKEDLVFDREEEFVARLRQLGPDPLAGAGELLLRLAREGHPLLASTPGAPAFWRLVESSATLRARSWEMTRTLETTLAQALVDRGQSLAVAEAAAGMVFAVWRAALREGLRGMEAAEAPERVRRRQLALLKGGLAAVGQGFGGRRRARRAQPKRP